MSAVPPKPTILIAEDEAIVARDIRALLVGMGYQPVAHASSAEQAIALAAQWRPDLVLMDINLAGEMDGITAAQLIRERFALPVVFLTAFAGGETLTRAKLAEPFGYITKPFNERELHTVIEIALYKHSVEAELRRSETKFRRLYDSTSDAVMLLDGKGFFDCNPATLATFGCASRDEFCTKHPADLSPPMQPGGIDSLTLANQRIAQAQAAGSLRFDWVHRRQDSGMDFDAEVLLSAMQLDGKPVLQAVVRDISARKRAEEQLRQTRQLLDSVVENIPTMIFVKRANDLRFELFNRAGEALLGVSRQALLGRSDHELFPSEQADAFTAADRRVIASGEVTDIPIEPIRTAGGQTRYLHTKKVVLRDEAGRASHLLGISLDITEQKQASEALLAAKEEAERANQAKSQFLSNMSHELRTPMNAVLGFAQLLENDPVAPLHPHQVEYVRQILRGGNHLLSLINEVLDLASIEAGRLSVQLVPVPLSALLDECMTMVQAAALERGIRVSNIDMASDECIVVADRTRLKQVLLNLLSNAIKYNRQQGRVEVVCAREGEHVLISVADSGPGLDASQQQRLFQPFERLDAANTATLGTGIGLALSRHLVQAMHGEIGVDSAVGKGSTFWVRLPRALGTLGVGIGPRLMAASAARAAAPVAAASAGAAPHTVLCIEDIRTNMALIQAMLAGRSDLQVISAMLPERGLELALSDRPRVILLDIQLPGIDGFEVLRRLRASPVTRPIPVVAVSASAMRADIDRGLAAGFDDYVTKPIDRARLLAAVDRALAIGAKR